MRALRFAIALMATSALAGLWACGQSPSSVQSPPQAAPQGLDAFGFQASNGPPALNSLMMDSVVARLPQRIPAALATKYLVHIDPSRVVTSGHPNVYSGKSSAPHFGVLDVNTESQSGLFTGPGLINAYALGLNYPFNQVYGSSLYYPYNNYYVPYYYNAGYYSPYSYYNYGLVSSASYPYSYTTSYPYSYTYGLVPTASTYSYNLGLTYPFLYSQANTYYPYTYNSAPPVTTVSSVGAAAPATITQTVTITDGQFNPGTLTVPVGTTVNWINQGHMPHTTTTDLYSPGQWDSGVIQPGGSYSVRFSNAGMYAYHCKLHPNMVGTIVVQ